MRVLIIAAVITSGLFFTYVVDMNFWTHSNKKLQASTHKLIDITINPKKFYKVTAVLDGDTFKVKGDDGVFTVRMLGINTPETIDPRKPPECFGHEASDETKSLLNNQEVKLILNPNREKKDKYGRILAYVYNRDGLFVNEFLIKEGFAREYTVGKPYDHQALFKQIENKARETHLGLWQACVI